MKSSETIGQLALALSKFQGTVPSIPKNRTATIPGKDGKQGYKYKYADLSDIIDICTPVLSEHGLSVMNIVGGDGENVFVKAVLLHESGEWIESDSLPLPAGRTPQTAGSSITYARRYTLGSLLGVAADEDDDGSAATHSADAGKNNRVAKAPSKEPAKPRAAAKPLYDAIAAAIERGADEAAVKKEVVRQWGMPDELSIEQIAEAVKFVQSLGGDAAE